MLNSKLSAALALVAVLALAGWAGSMDYQDEILEERAYCRNVTLYHATAGEQGWPDYEGYYSTVCAQYSDDPELFFKG